MIAFHGVHISFNRLDRSIMVGNGCMIPIVKINGTLDFDRFTLYLPAAENSSVQILNNMIFRYACGVW